MRQLTTFLVLALLACAQITGGANARGLGAAQTAQDVPLAGGYSQAAADSPEVLSAAKFAVAQKSRGRTDPITLVSVKRAERQVVAGMNYRLLLSVRMDGQVHDVETVVYQDLKRNYSLSKWEPSGAAAKATREVKVYLVAYDDQGASGKKIGCDDSLVAVTRTIKATGAPLKATVEELLAVPHEYDEKLRNHWWGENLSVKSASIRNGVATIHVTGNGPYIAGICDAPRIEEQMTETVKQFPGVRRVRVFVNNRPLASVVR